MIGFAVYFCRSCRNPFEVVQANPQGHPWPSPTRLSSLYPFDRLEEAHGMESAAARLTTEHRFLRP